MSFLENAIKRVARRLGATNPNEFPKAVSLNPEFPRAGRGSYNLGSSFPTTRFAGWGFPSADQLKSFAAGQKAALGGQPTTSPGTPSSPAAPGTVSQTSFEGLNSWVPQINQYAQKYNVHPAVFAVAMMQESGGDPRSVSWGELDPSTGQPVSGGLYHDHIRGRGAGQRGDQYSVEEQFDRAGREFQQYWNAHAGITDTRQRVLRTIADAQRYRNYQDPNSYESGLYGQWYDRLNPYFQEGQLNTPTAAQAGGIRTINQGVLAAQGGMTQAEAAAYCGPAAAAFLAAHYGNNIPPAEVARLTRTQSSWTPGAGMGGVQSFLNLAKAMGVEAQQGPMDWSQVASMAQQGTPVVLSSPYHYWQIQGYDPARNAFDVGESALRGYPRWLTPQQFEGVWVDGTSANPSTMIWRR